MECVKRKVLLLDMYGVIIKESKGYFVPYTLQHFEKQEHDRLIKAFREEKCFTKAQTGELSNQEFLEYLGYADPQGSMEDYLKNYLTLDEQFKPFAEKYSSAMDFYLLSNDVSEWSEFLTEYHRLNPFFKEKIISGDVGVRKPDKEIFVYALEKIGCKPQECIFVDNSVKNLLVAEELGIQTILFNRDGEAYGGRVVNDFEELGTLCSQHLIERGISL